MITLYTMLILVAIGAQAFFTATEMAFTSANRIKLKGLMDSGDLRARKLNDFLEKEGVYLGTTLVGTNIAVVISSVLATRVFAEYFGLKTAPLLATVCMVPVTLVFAEIVPKIIARQFATTLALKTVASLNSFFRLFYPVIVVVNFVARFFIAPFRKRKAASWDATLTKSDLKRILLLGHETGGVEEDEVRLIHKVLDFGTKNVEKIMIPLYRVSSISQGDTIDDLKKLVSLTGFSRVPIYEKNKNNIVGIVNIYDILFQIEESGGETPVKDFLRAPVYINRNDSLNVALTRLRYKEQPMGIVIDNRKSGTCAIGIITIEDILEEIVGEI